MPKDSDRRPYWKNNHEWVCPRHLPSVTNPASQGGCSFAGCISVRPRRVLVLDPCSYKKCDTLLGRVAPRRLKSKYCSDECRKKQARLNYRRRNGKV